MQASIWWLSDLFPRPRDDQHWHAAEPVKTKPYGLCAGLDGFCSTPQHASPLGPSRGKHISKEVAGFLLMIFFENFMVLLQHDLYRIPQH
jgi:hypothetical protein